MPPFIYYHIDPFSILVVIEHITFTSVFSTSHVSLSIDFTSALTEVSSPTDQLLDRPLGAPLRRANIRSRDRPQQRITPLQWPIHNGGMIYRVTLRDKYSRGSSHKLVFKFICLCGIVFFTITETPPDAMPSIASAWV